MCEYCLLLGNQTRIHVFAVEVGCFRVCSFYRLAELKRLFLYYKHAGLLVRSAVSSTRTNQLHFSKQLWAGGGGDL